MGVFILLRDFFFFFFFFFLFSVFVLFAILLSVDKEIIDSILRKYDEAEDQKRLAQAANFGPSLMIDLLPTVFRIGYALL
jgi:hypothetical protein